MRHYDLQTATQELREVLPWVILLIAAAAALVLMPDDLHGHEAPPAPGGAQFVCPLTGLDMGGPYEIVETDGSAWCRPVAPAVALLELDLEARAALAEPTAPQLPPECSRHRLAHPYPGAPVTAAHRSRLASVSGPWVAPDGSEYPDLESLRSDLWTEPWATVQRYRDATPPAGPYAYGVASEAIADVLRHPWIGSCCEEYSHQVLGAWRRLYRAEPSYGQRLLVMAHHPRRDQTNSHWWPDKRIYDADSCSNIVADPPVFSIYPHQWTEISWHASRARMAELGLVLRDQQGQPVTEARIRCHFRPETCATTPPPPPPRPPPERCPDICPGKRYGWQQCEPCPCPAGIAPGPRPWGRVYCTEDAPPPARTCTEYRGTLFVPGTPSTGRLELELFPAGEVPCPWGER